MKIVAIYEIIAGVVGLVMYVIVTKLNLAALLIAAVVPIAAILSLLGGYRILRERRGGIGLSMTSQVLQLPVITTSYLVYKLGLGIFLSLAAGLGATAGIAHFATNYEIQVGATVQFNIDSAPQSAVQWLFGVNIVALALLIVLWRARRRSLQRS